jgi:hypothetical protein
MVKLESGSLPAIGSRHSRLVKPEKTSVREIDSTHPVLLPGPRFQCGQRQAEVFLQVVEFVTRSDRCVKGSIAVERSRSIRIALIVGSRGFFHFFGGRCSSIV